MKYFSQIESGKVTSSESTLADDKNIASYTEAAQKKAVISSIIHK